jgi:hypothetical protein
VLHPRKHAFEEFWLANKKRFEMGGTFVILLTINTFPENEWSLSFTSSNEIKFKPIWTSLGSFFDGAAIFYPQSS